MNQTDSISRLHRLQDSLNQVEETKLKVLDSPYVLQLLMQEGSELRMEIASLKDYRRARGWKH